MEAALHERGVRRSHPQGWLRPTHARASRRACVRLGAGHAEPEAHFSSLPARGCEPAFLSEGRAAPPQDRAIARAREKASGRSRGLRQTSGDWRESPGEEKSKMKNIFFRIGRAHMTGTGTAAAKAEGSTAGAIALLCMAKAGTIIIIAAMAGAARLASGTGSPGLQLAAAAGAAALLSAASGALMAAAAARGRKKRR